MTRTGFRYTKVPLKILLSKAHKEKRSGSLKITSKKGPFLEMRRDSVEDVYHKKRRQKKQCRSYGLAYGFT